MCAALKCCKHYGGLAQLVEHLLCKQGVNGSNPLFSTFKEIIDMVGTQNEKNQAILTEESEKNRASLMYAKGPAVCRSRESG